MIKSLKKLFSVDESELDFDEMELADDYSSLYQDELKDNSTNVDKKTTKTEEIIKERGNRITEVIPVVQDPVSVTNKLSNLKSPETVLNVNSEEKEEEKPIRKSFDFAKEIEAAYERPYVDYQDSDNKVVVEKMEASKEEIIEKHDTKELVNKDTYVLKDIISPMRGVIRKEKNVIKRDEEVKKAQIIKLREHIKTIEIEPGEEYSDTMEFPSTNTKKLNGSLAEPPKNTLSETSKFTLIEDSTGEMRLVIDEDK